MLQDVLRRLDKAFAAFFRRVSNGETPGYPRFKSTSRYHSFTYPDQAGWQLGEKHLTLSGVGGVKIKLHRPIQGKIKTVTIRREVDQWYATFSCAVPEAAPLPPTDAAVGLDLGVLSFATLSTGEHLENLRHYHKGLKRIKVRSQVKDRCTKGSHRRKRAAIALARAHRKVRNRRTNFHHQLSRRLVNAYGLLAMEDLSILNLTATPEPKPDPDHEGQYLPNGAAAKAGLNQSILDADSRPVPILLHRQGCKCRTACGIGRPPHDQPARASAVAPWCRNLWRSGRMRALTVGWSSTATTTPL